MQLGQIPTNIPRSSSSVAKQVATPTAPNFHPHESNSDTETFTQNATIPITMGLSLFTHSSNCPLTALRLDESIAQARQQHAHFAKVAKQAENHLEIFQIATNNFVALTVQIQDLGTQPQEARAIFDRSMVDMQGLYAELEWRLRHYRRTGGDVVRRAPATVVAELSELDVHAKEQTLSINQLQEALEAKQEALVYWEAECGYLEDVTARCTEHLDIMGEDLKMRPVPQRRALDDHLGDVDAHPRAVVNAPLTLRGDRGSGVLRPLTRSMVSFDQFMEAAQSSSRMESSAELFGAISSLSQSSQLLSPPADV